MKAHQFKPTITKHTTQVVEKLGTAEEEQEKYRLKQEKKNA